MTAKIIIGVMGPANPTESDNSNAYKLGECIAKNGWILLNGGRNVGIMDSSAKGAKNAGGLTIGILPDEDKQHMSEYIDIPILTGMGSARNNINVLSSDIVVACGSGTGTSSEIALALKAGKKVIILQDDSSGAYNYFFNLAGDQVLKAENVENTIELIRSNISFNQ